MLITRPCQAAQQRFTLDGGDELEQQLQNLCARIRRAVLDLVSPPRLEALVLGGGYGRGQGGVLATENGEAPYNDLEFYVFVRGNVQFNSRKYGPAFQRLERKLSAGAGLHVEFKIDSLDRFGRRPVSIFTYDLVSGHRLVYGRENIFANGACHADPARIPASEATRLLLNRCSGLLLAKQLLLQDSLTADEADFIGRNLAKAQLALGDSLLVLVGKYHWDCLERARFLRELSRDSLPAMLRAVFEHHAAGVRFKLHPKREDKTVSQFRSEHRAITDLALQEWLWIENDRLGTHFSDFGQYSLSRVDKCSERGSMRNLLLNLRTFGPGVVLDRNAWRYPRQRLLHALPLLLSNGRPSFEPGTTRHLQSQLRTRADDWTGLVDAYKRLWNCYG